MRKPQQRPSHSQAKKVAPIDQNLEFPEYITRWREYNELNQQELAVAAKISSSYVTFIEQKKKLPSEKICVQLAEALGRPAKEVVERMRRAREKKDPEVAEALAYEIPTYDRYNEGIRRFLEAYEKLPDSDKRIVEEMLPPLTKLMEGRIKSA